MALRPFPADFHNYLWVRLGTRKSTGGEQPNSASIWRPWCRPSIVHARPIIIPCPLPRSSIAAAGVGFYLPAITHPTPPPPPSPSPSLARGNDVAILDRRSPVPPSIVPFATSNGPNGAQSTQSHPIFRSLSFHRLPPAPADELVLIRLLMSRSSRPCPAKKFQKTASR